MGFDVEVLTPPTHWMPLPAAPGEAGSDFARSVLDNVREEIRPEVEYALNLARGEPQ